MNWINVDEQKPKTKQSVIVYFETWNGKYNFVSIADYIAPRTVLTEEYGDEESWGVSEYDEENDCSWIEEGFYEWSYESDTCWKISEKVTHWMPVPECPKVS